MIIHWVKISWLSHKYLNMASFAHGTVTAMTANKNFLTPKVALKVVDDAATRVEVAYANRKNGQVGKDELLNSSSDLNVKLHDQADYVSVISDGDDTIIHSGGWETTGKPKQKKAIPVSGAAPALKATAGGNIKVISAKIADAKLYVFVLIIGTEFPVTLVDGAISIPLGVQSYILNSTKCFASFSNIPGLQEVTVGMFTVNSAGISPLSALSTCANVGNMIR
jgi:hypothetical protein